MGAGMTAGGTPANTSLGRFDQIEYVRAADTSPGTMVLLGSLYGLDTQGGVSGSLGALMIEGGVQIPNPDSVAIVAGGTVGYDFTNQKATAAAVGDADIGKAIEAASGTNPLKVKLIQTP